MSVRLLETMRAERGRVPLLDRHLARLAASAEALGYAFRGGAVRDALAAALDRAAPADVHRVRLTLGRGLDVDAEASPLDADVFQTVWLCPEPLAEAGGPLCVHKTTDREHYERRYREARARGADEAVLMNARGEVVEGTRTSVWAEHNGQMLTPPLSAGGLAGVARAVLLETFPGAGEATLTPDDLRSADALYLSNAVRGLVRVRLPDESVGDESGRIRTGGRGVRGVPSHLPHVMNSILGILSQNLAGAPMGQLAQAIGADEAQTQRAVGAALPALLAGLDRNTNTNGGAQALAGALERDHDGSLLDQLGGFLTQAGGQRQAGGGLGGLLGGGGGGGGLGGMLGGLLGGKATDGGGILGHVLGGQRGQVEQGVSQASGLNMGQVAKLLPILAPIVMAAIGKHMRQRKLDSAGLSGALGQEATRARHAAPDGLLGHLTGFLDADGDGNVKDDLMKRAGQAALGRLFGR